MFVIWQEQEHRFRAYYSSLSQLGEYSLTDDLKLVEDGKMEGRVCSHADYLYNRRDILIEKFLAPEQYRFNATAITNLDSYSEDELPSLNEKIDIYKIPAITGLFSHFLFELFSILYCQVIFLAPWPVTPQSWKRWRLYTQCVSIAIQNLDQAPASFIMLT